MTEFCFNPGPGHLSKQADAIARKHGAVLVNFTEPNGHKRHWFEGPSRGYPFDADLARVVVEALRAAGIEP